MSTINGKGNQKVYTLIEVDVRSLKRAPYQRPVDRSRVDRMAQNFQLELVGAIVLSRRGGNLYILAGSHRAAAAEVAGETILPAVVYDNLTYEREAEIFLRNATSTKALRPFDKYKAGIELGDSTALELQKQARAFGLTVSGSGAPNTLSAVGAGLTLVEKGLFTKVMSVARDAWFRPAQSPGQTDQWVPRSLEGSILRGIGYVFSLNGGKVDSTRLASVLEQYRPGDLAGNTGGGNASLVAREIITRYNKGLRKNRLTTPRMKA